MYKNITTDVTIIGQRSSRARPAITLMTGYATNPSARPSLTE